MTPAEPEPPGVPEERTDLAWQRTGLGVLAVAALLGHRAVVAGRPEFLPGAVVAALLGVVLLGGPGSPRHRRRGPAAGLRNAAGATTVVVLVAVAAAVAVAVPR